jgi:hypothetical protein
LSSRKDEQYFFLEDLMKRLAFLAVATALLASSFSAFADGTIGHGAPDYGSTQYLTSSPVIPTHAPEAKLNFMPNEAATIAASPELQQLSVPSAQALVGSSDSQLIAQLGKPAYESVSKDGSMTIDYDQILVQGGAPLTNSINRYEFHIRSDGTIAGVDTVVF